MNKMILVLFLMTFCRFASAATKTPADWTKLTGASVLLNSAAEAALPSPLFCSLDPVEARALRTKLEKRIDTTMSSWASAHKHAVTYADPSWPVSCHETCSCGLDASLLERVGLAHLGTQDRWIFRRVSTLALEQTPSAASECAARQTWFCNSSLLKQLRHAK